MRLPAEPRIESGSSFMFSLKAWMRQVAQLVNPTADAIDAATKAIAVLQAQASPTGKFAHFALDTPPAGWIAGDGSTIGNVGSGATRANVDTLALFTAWWSAFTDAQLPILTSAGAASTRGANAAADWAALKRLTVFDVRGRFMRNADGSASLNGTKYAGTRITRNGGNAGALVNVWSSEGFSDVDAAAGITADYSVGGVTSTGNGSLETIAPRPINLALLGCFKL